MKKLVLLLILLCLSGGANADITCVGPGCGGSSFSSSTSALQIRVKRVTFSIAQIIACNTSPVTILPAVTGYTYIIPSSVLMRDGARYATQPGAAQLRVPGQAVPYVSYSATLLTDTTSSPTHSAEFRLQSAAGFAGDAATQFGSKGVEFFCATANPTVDGPNPGSPVVLVLYYYQVPTYPVNAPPA